MELNLLKVGMSKQVQPRRKTAMELRAPKGSNWCLAIKFKLVKEVWGHEG